MGHIPGRGRRRVTTAAPPCALLTPVTWATMAGKPAYPMCTHWSWRGDAAPPFGPPASRAAARAPGGRGPPPDPRTGALTAQRRTVVVAARLTRADQAAFGPAEAHRLPDALEPGHEVVSGLGERWLDACVGIEGHTAAGDIAGRRPLPAAQTGSKPSAGIDRAAGAGWERPRTPQISPSVSPDSGAVDRTIGGGSLPAPLCAQKRSLRLGRMRPKRNGATGFRERSRVRGTRISTQLRGV